MDERNQVAQVSTIPAPAGPAVESEEGIVTPHSVAEDGPTFRSSERPPKLFKIGEVMRYSRLSRQTLHNYTMMGLIEESERTESGHRLYPESVFSTLERIELLKRHRPLREVRAILEAERVHA